MVHKNSLGLMFAVALGCALVMPVKAVFWRAWDESRTPEGGRSLFGALPLSGDDVKKLVQEAIKDLVPKIPVPKPEVVVPGLSPLEKEMIRDMSNPDHSPVAFVADLGKWFCHSAVGIWHPLRNSVQEWGAFTFKHPDVLTGILVAGVGVYAGYRAYCYAAWLFGSKSKYKEKRLIKEENEV